MLLPMPSCSERLSVQFLHDFACAGCSRSDVNNCVGMHQNGMLEKRVLGGTQLRCPLNSAHHNLCSLQISQHHLENSHVQEQPPPPPRNSLLLPTRSVPLRGQVDSPSPFCVFPSSLCQNCRCAQIEMLLLCFALSLSLCLHSHLTPIPSPSSPPPSPSNTASPPVSVRCCVGS